MPRQVITLEIEYNIFYDPDDEGDNELRDEPKYWSIEAALDHYSECQAENTMTMGVKVIQASPPIITEHDKQMVSEHNTTLLELGLFE